MSIFSKLFGSKKLEENANSPKVPKVDEEVPIQELYLSYREEGLKHLAEGNYVLSLEFFQAAIEKNKCDEAAYIGLSNSYIALGKMNDAERTIYQLLAIDPGSKKAQEQLDKIKGKRSEQESFSVTQPQKKYSEEELRERIRESIKVNIGKSQEGQNSAIIPFNPKYELQNYSFPTMDLFNDAIESNDGNIHLYDLFSSDEFQNINAVLPCVVGKTIDGKSYVIDLAKMPNVLIAGASGTGKSTLCHAMVFSLLLKMHPSELKLVLVDLKGLEFNYYDGIERHFLAKLPDVDNSIATDDNKSIRTLESLCIELDERVFLLKDAGCRNIIEYNEKFKARKLLPTIGHRYLPYIVLVIDDYSLLVSSKGKEANQAIIKVLGMGKAVGIHAIVGTSRVTSDVFSVQMKSCIPARIAFRVNSASESRSLLDVVGANMLGVYGEMMALIPGNSVIKIKGASVSSIEIKTITEFIGNQRGYTWPFLLPEVPSESDDGFFDIYDDGERDSLFEEAARIVVQTQQGSTSMIQRKLKLGYNRAGRILDQLEAAGIVGPFTGSKSREVKMTSEAALEQILRDLYNKDNGI